MTERNREPQGAEPEGRPPPDGSGLRQLKHRLAAARARNKRGADGEPETSGAGIAMRVGIEMVGSVAVGVGIGWGLDRWLGTKPWLFLVFFFLGGAAGMLNVYRTVTNIGLAPGYRTGERTGDEDEDEGEAKRGGR